jgi:hypothetical protein
MRSIVIEAMACIHTMRFEVFCSNLVVPIEGLRFMGLELLLLPDDAYLVVGFLKIPCLFNVALTPQLR